MLTNCSQTRLPRAFVLPVVLLLSAGILILLLALVSIVGLEATTSRARAGAYQADLAVESGFEEAQLILARAMASDSYVVGVQALAVEFDDNDDGTISSEEDGVLDSAAGERGRPYLYAIQGEVTDGEVCYRLTPLFATHEGPSLQSVAGDEGLVMPSEPGLSSENQGELDNQIAVRGTPHLQAPVTAWRTIRDENEAVIGRYSYWVEDMQGYLDAELVGGNERKSGAHARANEVWAQQGDSWNPAVSALVADYIAAGGAVPLWPAPGLNPSYVKEQGEDASGDNSPLSEAAVYTLDQNQGGLVDESDFDDTIRDFATKAPTPASLLALSGVAAPLLRVATGEDRGRLALQGGESATEPRWIEEHFVTGNQSWEEFALIPFVPGVAPEMMGALRLNLNEKLASLSEVSGSGNVAGEQSVVGEIAQHISASLPNFAKERRGGFGDWQAAGRQDEAYLEAIAASMIDYADQDNTPTVTEGRYRGVDSHPLITEYLITHRLVGFEQREGANFIIIEVETFAELWNMSNHATTGMFELGYTNPYVFEALGNPEVEFLTVLNTTGANSTQSWSTHSLAQSEDDGRWYSLPRAITIPANGYTLVSTGVITYHLLVSPEGGFLPLPIELTPLGLSGISNYALRWNDVLCDRSGGGLDLTSLSLSLQEDEEQVTKALICGTWGEFGRFYSGMFDPRQSWWAGLDNDEGVVSENSYPQNYTPGRRTVRYGSIARNNEDLLFGRMLVSEWPDGGHDSSFDLASYPQKSNSDGNRALRPDDRVELYPGDLASEPLKAPVFISNLGRYFSESELGNIYDPMMWRSGSNPRNTEEIWVRDSINETENNNVPEVDLTAEKATVVGGGNSLRIGRPEHARFDEPGVRAAQLLDLFHCGEPLATLVSERIGGKRRIAGHVNVNTAPREVLRALAAGILASDPLISVESASFDTSSTFAPEVSTRFEAIAATDAIAGSGLSQDEAGAIADAIIAGRPFLSRSQLAHLRYSDTPDTVRGDDLKGQPVFGNKRNHEPGASLQASDRALEEVFGRLYNSTTVRSRNFRVHVIGQALEQTPSGKLRIKATRKKSYRVFVDSGEQDSAVGAFDSAQISVETHYESNL